MRVYSHSVPDRFREIVAAHGDRPAVRWSKTDQLTFNDLNRLSEQVASFLLGQGVRKGDTVGVRLDKCTLAYSLIIACLKIGAPYFVVDPNNPMTRVEHILKTCAPKLVFSAKELPLAVDGYHLIEIDRERQFEFLETGGAKPSTKMEAIVGTDPSYIMFTSGSTGVPKGAVMSHANLLNFIAWARTEFSVTTDDVFTNVNPLYFDNSVFDLYASIMNGASLVPFDAATMRDPYKALRRIDEMKCTIYFSVPSLLIYFQTLKILTSGTFAHARTIIFGGEGYPKAKLKEVFDYFHPRVEIVNVYGPTECTCICSAYRVTAIDFKDLTGYSPLGGPIPNFSFHILTENDQLAPVGEIGELCLGGPCVGLGYYNQPELSAKVFTRNPLQDKYHERIYHTGDLVRLSTEDGKVYFVGRKDSQIKHQGYRIELSEIEHALCKIAGIDEAVALHGTRDGFSKIIAIVASANGLTANAIRQQVASALPAYMIPGQVEVLPHLPKNDNGKIDRNLLRTRYC